MVALIRHAMKSSGISAIVLLSGPGVMTAPAGREVVVDAVFVPV